MLLPATVEELAHSEAQVTSSLTASRMWKDCGLEECNRCRKQSFEDPWARGWLLVAVESQRKCFPYKSSTGGLRPREKISFLSFIRLTPDARAR